MARRRRVFLQTLATVDRQARLVEANNPVMSEI